MTKSVFTDEYEQFRNLLVEARKSCSITQAELAARLGKPQSFVSKYERGERRLDLIEFIAIAHALGLNAGKFVDQIEHWIRKRSHARPVHRL
jgi:transcriptional regulator with XRE-family HTH domain